MRTNSKALNKLKKSYSAVTCLPALALPKTPLFLISHMRARTTLLSHILGSSPEVCGHNELHFNYHSLSSYIGLKLELLSEKNFSRAKYLHDKILHNQDILEQKFIDKLKPKIIVVIRQAIPSIRSIYLMKKSNNKRCNILDIAYYYLNRLDYLREFAALNSKKFLFIESDALIKDKEKTLSTITNYLHLNEALSENYQIFGDTGATGKGDPSRNIHSGKIINTSTNEAPPRLELPDETTANLEDQYRTTKEILSQHSI